MITKTVHQQNEGYSNNSCHRSIISAYFLIQFSLILCYSFSDQTPVMLFKFLMMAVLAVVFPFPREASSEICPRWVKLNKSPVCFGVKGNQYGRFSYHRNMFVSLFMLVHRSGNKPQELLGMCSKSSKPSHHLDRPE